MAPRFFVRDTDDVIVSATENDDLDAPTGTTAVLRSVIAAAYDGPIYQGGTWDGTTYTAPAGQATPFDLTTETGRLRQAALNCHEALISGALASAHEGIMHPHSRVVTVHDYWYQMHHGMYLAMNNHRAGGSADWTAAQRIAGANAAALGPLDGSTPHDLYAAVEAASLSEGPTTPILWLNFNTGARVNVADITSNTTAMALDASQLPSDSILSGAWIPELTA